MSNQLELFRAGLARLEGENNCGTSDFIEAKRIAFEQVREVLDAIPVETTPSDIQEASKNYADEQLAGHNRELAESGHTRHFKMGYVCFAGYEIEAAFADGMLAERERLMKEAHDGMIERDCCGQVMLDVPDIWEHGDYTLLNQQKYPDMKPGERRRVKVLIVENE